VNGVDYSQWSPCRDPHLVQRFTKQDWQSGKAACKGWLQAELGLDIRPDVPLIGIVSRLVDQKGWYLIIPLLLKLAHNKDVQWAILGTGELRYEEQLAELAEFHPQNIGLRLAFSEPLAHQIEAGSDMFLMPS